MRQTKTVVITGASSGIGRACALHLDKLGWHVLAGVRRQRDGALLQQVASSRLRPLLIDVTDEAMIKTAVDMVTEVVGTTGLAGLVNNAGILIPGPLEFMPLADIKQLFAVNLVGQISVTQAFLPLLRQRRGRIVNMGSIGGRVALPFMGAYTASKFALTAFTDALRAELRPWQMDVVIVEPGFVRTAIWENAFPEAAVAQLPPTARSLYGGSFAELRTFIKQVSYLGSSPADVATAVEQALTALRPKTRYLVGYDARLGHFASKFIPDRLRDWLLPW